MKGFLFSPELDKEIIFSPVQSICSILTWNSCKSSWVIVWALMETEYHKPEFKQCLTKFKKNDHKCISSQLVLCLFYIYTYYNINKKWNVAQNIFESLAVGIHLVVKMMHDLNVKMLPCHMMINYTNKRHLFLPGENLSPWLKAWHSIWHQGTLTLLLWCACRKLSQVSI